MDTRLLNVCRYTGVEHTAENDTDFIQCSNCGGYTRKKLGEGVTTKYDLTQGNKIVVPEKVEIPPADIVEREGGRCSHCGEVLP